MMHYNSTTIMVQWTTPRQLEMIKKELLQRYNEVGILWRIAQAQADCTDQIDPDLDELFNGLENMLCDLDEPGFGREDLPQLGT